MGIRDGAILRGRLLKHVVEEYEATLMVPKMQRLIEIGILREGRVEGAFYKHTSQKVTRKQRLTPNWARHFNIRMKHMLENGRDVLENGNAVGIHNAR